MQTIHLIESNGSAKDFGNFQFSSPSAATFEEAGFSPVASENLEYLLKAQLGTHQLKEQFKRDFDIMSGKRENVSETEREVAAERMESGYTYNFSSPPKQRSGSKWGDLKDYIPLAQKTLGKDASNDALRAKAQELKDHMASMFEVA